jgi:hypothetical protein
MISIIHYISASRRHQQFQDTIVQLGGENDAPLQMRAQRDIIAMERDYYRDKMFDFFFILAIMSVLSALVFITYYIFFMKG